MSATGAVPKKKTNKGTNMKESNTGEQTNQRKQDQNPEQQKNQKRKPQEDKVKQQQRQYQQPQQHRQQIQNQQQEQQQQQQQTNNKEEDDEQQRQQHNPRSKIKYYKAEDHAEKIISFLFREKHVEADPDLVNALESVLALNGAAVYHLGRKEAEQEKETRQSKAMKADGKMYRKHSERKCPTELSNGSLVRLGELVFPGPEGGDCQCSSKDNSGLKIPWHWYKIGGKEKPPKILQSFIYCFFISKSDLHSVGRFFSCIAEGKVASLRFPLMPTYLGKAKQRKDGIAGRIKAHYNNPYKLTEGCAASLFFIRAYKEMQNREKHPVWKDLKLYLMIVPVEACKVDILEEALCRAADFMLCKDFCAEKRKGILTTPEKNAMMTLSLSDDQLDHLGKETILTFKPHDYVWEHLIDTYNEVNKKKQAEKEMEEIPNLLKCIIPSNTETVVHKLTVQEQPELWIKENVMVLQDSISMLKDNIDILGKIISALESREEYQILHSSDVQLLESCICVMGKNTAMLKNHEEKLKSRQGEEEAVLLEQSREGKIAGAAAL